MSGRTKAWAVGWRLAVCGVLLAWILHSIFTHEARVGFEQAGGTWSALPRAQQWQLAWQQGPAELWNTLRLATPAALAGSFGLVGVTLLLGVARWRLVLRVQGLDLPFTRTTEIALVAHFFNSFLLGSTGGDLLKAYYAARETHHLKTEAVTTVVADRLIGLLSMLLFAAALTLPHASLVLANSQLAAPAFAILAMLAALAAITTLSFWGGLSRRFPGARARLRRLPRGETLERVLDACRQFGRSPGPLLGAVGFSMLLNVACVLQFIVLARALGLTVPAPVLFFVVPTIVCLAALPITPSGLGVRENLFVVMLSAPGIDASPALALALSLLAYAGSLAWSVVGGLVYACFKHRHHLDQVARES